MLKKLFIVFILLIVSVAKVSAQNWTVGKNSEKSVFTLKAGETVNEDVFAAGERVEIAGVVNGDLYAAGANIYISGQVTGDILAAGGTINFTGNVGQDLRIAGGNIVVSGKVGNNASIAGGNITLTSDAVINGGLATVFGNEENYAVIGRYLKGAGGNLTLGNKVDGNVQLGIGKLNIADSGRIAGNLEYWSDEKANISESAVTGTTIHNIPAKPQKLDHTEIKNKAGKAFGIGSLVFSFILGLVYLWLFPLSLKKTALNINEKPLLSLLWGVASPFIFIALFILLFLTLVGIPLAIFIVFAYMFLLYWVRIPVMFFLGEFISGRLGYHNQNRKPVWSFVFGLLIYWILTHLPFLGGVFHLLALATGMGAFILTFINKKETRVQAAAKVQKKSKRS